MHKIHYLYHLNSLKYFKLRIVHVLLYAFVLIILLFGYYSGNYMVLGGEGCIFSDFNALHSNYGSTWYNIGAGFPGININYGVLLGTALSLMQKVLGVQILNFLILFLPNKMVVVSADS